MTDIRFYHMEQSTLDQALPAITAKAYQSGKHILIKTNDKKEAQRLNDLLWSFRADMFIPHGAEGDKDADQQPIWITSGDDNPNGASILILTHGMTSENIADFDMACEMLDGRVESQIKEARARWKTYKTDNHDLTYWQQDDNGKWNKKG